MIKFLKHLYVIGIVIFSVSALAIDYFTAPTLGLVHPSKSDEESVVKEGQKPEPSRSTASEPEIYGPKKEEEKKIEKFRSPDYDMPMTY